MTIKKDIINNKINICSPEIEKILDNINDAIFIHDLAGKFLFVNKTTCDRLGYSREELLKFGPQKIDSPKFAKMVPTRIEELKKNGQAIFETAHITKKGQEIPIEINSKVIDYLGQKAVLSVARDVTHRKNDENKIKENEERYGLVIKASNDGVWDWNIKTNEVYFSANWKKMLGYKEEEIKNEFSEWERLLFVDDKERVKKYVNNYIVSKEKDKFEIEFRMDHKNGGQVDILARAYAMKDTKGNIIRLVGTHIDNTYRKMAERRFQELFKNMNNGIAIYEAFDNGKDFIFKDLNPASERMNNVKKEDIIGKKITEVFPGVEKMGLFKVLQDVYKNGQTQDMPASLYEDKKMKKWIKNTVYRLPNKELIAIHQDVTDQKESENNIKNKAEEMEKLNKFMIGRELKMMELKNKIKELEK